MTDATSLGSDGSQSDGAVAGHTGGWRSADHDGARSGRSETTGPGAGAGSGSFYQDTNDYFFTTPVIDEDGSLYFVFHVSHAKTELASMTPTGVVRWHVPLDTTDDELASLALAPNGDVLGIDTKPLVANSVPRLMQFDPATGIARNTGLPLDGLAEFEIDGSGLVEILRTTASGFSLERRDGGHPATWTRQTGGRAFALAPAGDAIVVAEAVVGEPYFDVVSIDPTTGANRWSYPLAQNLTDAPAIAIDSDGSVIVSSSTSGDNLVVSKLAATGTLQWTTTVTGKARPHRIVITSNSIALGVEYAAGQPNSNFEADTGVLLEKATGHTRNVQLGFCAANSAASDNTIYWSCDTSAIITDELGATLHTWPNVYTYDIVLAPNHVAYWTPAESVGPTNVFGRLQ